MELNELLCTMTNIINNHLGATYFLDGLFYTFLGMNMKKKFCWIFMPCFYHYA
ncbi:MAG: hypothetical protein ACJAX4_003648 [Clostridium sp.]|jgi:hypothetical protein